MIMTKKIYHYTFSLKVPIEEIESSLVLAILTTESLHGETQTRLDVSHYLDTTKRTCVIDAGTPVGRDLNRLFTGFVGREFGPDAFSVNRVKEHIKES
jgi:hypothetical protein